MRCIVIKSLSNEGFRSELVRLNLPSFTARADQMVSVDELKIPKAAKKYYDVGKKAAGAHDWRNALVAFNNAVAAYPRYARAFNAMGVVLAITAEPPEAESAFRYSIQLNPKFAESHFNLGRLLLESNRASEARRELERSLELGEGTSSAIELLVESMLVTNDLDSALSLMRSLHLKHFMHSPGLHLKIGSALEDLSQSELASDQYSLVLTENASESERRNAESALSRVKH